MTTIVLPRPRAALGAETTAAGKLASTLLSVTLAGSTEPGRFRRGRAYALDGSVVSLELEPGVLRAEVAGSQASPYRVQVRVAAVAPPPGMGAVPERAHITRLVPDNDEFDAWCDCPDADSPCKHAAAALLALADELQSRPELLVAWRCATDGEPARAAVGARAGTGRHLHSVPGTGGRISASAGVGGSGPTRPVEPSPFATDEWLEFVGTPSPDPATEGAGSAPRWSAHDWTALIADLPPPARASLLVGRVDVGRLVASMTDAVARTLGGPPR